MTISFRQHFLAIPAVVRSKHHQHWPLLLCGLLPSLFNACLCEKTLLPGGSGTPGWCRPMLLGPTETRAKNENNSKCGSRFEHGFSEWVYAESVTLKSCANKLSGYTLIFGSPVGLECEENHLSGKIGGSCVVCNSRKNEFAMGNSPWAVA